MKIIKRIALLLFIILAIVGFITVILLLLGYRPIIENDVKPNWEAISSILTFFAVIAALFITKWQDMLNNRKEIKIEWGHIENDKYRNISFFGFPEERRIDEIVVRFINTGNRKIILSCVYLHFHSNTDNHLIPQFIAPKGKIPEMTFPCEIEPENFRFFIIPCNDFINAIIIFIKNFKIKENDELIIVAEDTTGKKYKHNTKLQYQSYLKYRSQQTGYQ